VEGRAVDMAAVVLVQMIGGLIATGGEEQMPACTPASAGGLHGSLKIEINLQNR